MTSWLRAVSLLFVASCAAHRPLAQPAAPLTAPSRLCAAGEAQPSCRPSREVEQLLASPAQIVGIADPPSGAQGAKLMTLRARHAGREVVFRAKWRPYSSGGLINEPRKELASYAVQKLFLGEGELVAPPTVARCFSAREYHRFVAREPSTFTQIPCVLGFLSYWLEDVRTVDGARREGWLGAGSGILDRELFSRDATYRHSIANANLLTHIINHGDAHNEQFLLEQTPRGLRAYVVDSSIAFLSIKNPMLLVREDWSQIQVPQLPEPAVLRLSRLSDRDFEALGSVMVLERFGDELRPAASPAAAAASDGSPMSWDGDRLRFGLTKGEIELVRSRARALVHDRAPKSRQPT